MKVVRPPLIVTSITGSGRVHGKSCLKLWREAREAFYNVGLTHSGVVEAGDFVLFLTVNLANAHMNLRSYNNS